jgi:hypothetical protein
MYISHSIGASSGKEYASIHPQDDLSLDGKYFVMRDGMYVLSDVFSLTPRNQTVVITRPRR